MNISEIRVKLTNDPRNKLKAYCSITLDDSFVVRDLKVIEGGRGPFVAMPSRKLADRCSRCREKNHLRAAYCNGCGQRLPVDRAVHDARGRQRLHADLAHPINTECRVMLHEAVIQAWRDEVARSEQAGYVPKSFDDFDEPDEFIDEGYVSALVSRAAKPPGSLDSAEQHGAADG